MYADLKAAGKILFDLGGPKGTKDGDLSNAVRGMEQGASAFGWPLATTSTVDCVAQGHDSSGLYVQRASKAAKDGGKSALLATCLAYNAALKAMQEWVKENAKIGVSWNAKGVSPKDYTPGAPSPAGAASIPAPAAPTAPPPASSPVPASSTSPSGPAPNLGALFSAISSIDQSSGKTAGLRHVTKDMKSKGEGGAVVSAATTTTPKSTAPTAFSNGPKMGTPKLEEQGMRWVCEFYTKDVQKGEILQITGASIKHEVYIYACKCVHHFLQNCSARTGM